MCAVTAAIAVPPSAGAYPAWWKHQAACIRHYESRERWDADTGNGYFGAFQFLLSTWESAAPRSFPRNPAAASPAEQTLVAWRVWRRDGGSWAEWGTARLCGVR